MKKVRGPRTTGVPDRGAMLVLEGPANACVLVNLESVVPVPAQQTFYFYQLRRRKGTCLSMLMFCLHPIYVLLKAANCLWQCDWWHQCPLCV